MPDQKAVIEENAGERVKLPLLGVIVMTYLGLFFLSHAPAVAGSKGKPEKDVPYLSRANNSANLVLPQKMREALRKYNPKFQLWKLSEFVPSHLKDHYKITSRQAPFAVLGDFNGDGVKDAALYGHDNRNDLIVVLLSGSGGYKAVEVEKRGLSNPSSLWTETRSGKEYGLDVYLQHFPKGKVDFGESGSLNLKTDSFELNLHFKGGHFYYWKDGKFVKRTVGC